MDEQTYQKNWFGRNWKWAVPTFGCLTIIILAIVFAGTLFLGVTTMFKDSIPYKEAMTSLKSNETVIAQLGEPIETNGMIKGNIDIKGNQGSADYKIPVKGPKGEATLMVIAEKFNGNWKYEILQVTFDESGEKIDLLVERNAIE